MRFASECGRFSVVVSKAALVAMETATKAHTERETGGILIGRYSADLHTAFVEQGEEMPSDSAGTVTRFVRGTRGLRGLLQRLWAASPRTYYLGEWHYHPALNTTPSSTDLAQMRSIALAANYQCPEPILVILGRPAGAGAERPMHVAVVTPSETVPTVRVMGESRHRFEEARS